MLPAGHSFGTEFALVDGASLVGFNPYNFSLVDHEVKPTADTAIRAGCGYISKRTCFIRHFQSHLFTGLDDRKPPQAVYTHWIVFYAKLDTINFA
jgi:hypothetical protein